MSNYDLAIYNDLTEKVNGCSGINRISPFPLTNRPFPRKPCPVLP